MRQLGSRYVLDSVIGRGGFGQVWRGRDVDGQVLAFKLLHDSYGADEYVVQRFVQERSILTSLDHPNLVRVHDMVMEGETLALVMDFIDGADLKSRLRSGPPLGAEAALSLAAGVAAGLDAAHAGSVIHRDIKPENVLVETLEDGSLRARIVDFGISRIAGSGASATMVAGTLAYMAPELFDERPPSVASDLYAFGVLLYEMLAGTPPYRSDSFASLMRMHTVAQPSRPEGMADEVWSLIERLLRKAPEERPTSAGEVARVLEGLAEGRPVTVEIGDATVLRIATPKPAPPPSSVPPGPVDVPPPARLRPPWLRWIGAGAVAVVVVGALAFAVGWLSRDDPPDEVPVASGLTCWDGSRIEEGAACPATDDERALFWAFGIDQDSADCTRTRTYRWSEIGYACQVDGNEVRLAVWLTPRLRDERLVSYGPAEDAGNGLIRHAPGSGDRHLLRYDSDSVLLYASAGPDQGANLDRLASLARSLDDLQHGVESTE